ncbi:uncharacterized protein ASPGLDRAFT_35638 [Aspergillus glaucus CBS 516.65]|uniref:Uncharacterized protein n=1 Tax=Aspergillus glaucus CBS 516.65 TaxID=1160497 RepID=A0A1L9VKG6_ASPGL|nr:hypothetical protein ASPGLDRAFT_35638 [Aspergillus glaucus CBS 516.65]OJJ84370.1 hypothetical protein ASPGLDRAFT_35638 [Aspergillus glaucus CBS 516.65]
MDMNEDSNGEVSDEALHQEGYSNDDEHDDEHDDDNYVDENGNYVDDGRQEII